MDKLQALNVFVTIAKQNSFAKAAEALDLSAPMMSRYLAWLEKNIGVRLINRTTRLFSLTEAGQKYLQYAENILTSLDEADINIKQDIEQPQGLLRISVPMFLGQQAIIPIITQFLKQYPLIQIEMTVESKQINLLEDNYDLALRVARKLEPNIVAKKLCRCRSLICAAPRYLKQHGIPKTLKELSKHQCLLYPFFLQQTWQFSEADQIAEIMVAGRLKINNIYALVNATIAGHGIAYLPKLLVMEHIKKGHLVEINLRGAKPIAPYIYAIYPTRHFLPVKVRLFIDALTAWLSPIAPWDRED